MSVSSRDPVVTPQQGLRLPFSARVRHAQPQASLEALLESWRRLVPEATVLTISATLPLGVDAQRARQALLEFVTGWSSLSPWFEHASLCFDVSATGTATDFCTLLSTSASSAGLGLVLDLPVPSRQATAARSPGEGPEALRRLATLLQPRLAPTLTLASRWLCSRDDAQWAIEQGLPVRLVPGIDADPRQPQRDPGAGVRALVRQIAGKVPQVTLAWPEPGAALDVMRALHRAGTACDLELPPGSPWGALRQVARSAGVAARVHGRWQALSGELNSQRNDVRPQ